MAFTAKQASIWGMVKAREQEGGKKHDAQILARARAQKPRHTFPGRQPSRLPSLSNTMASMASTRPLGKHFERYHLTPRGPRLERLDTAAHAFRDNDKFAAAAIEQIVAEKSRLRAIKMQALTDNSYPAHDPSAEIPVFAGQEYLNNHRKYGQIRPVKACLKYLQGSTVRSLPCYTNVSTIAKSLETLGIDAKFMDKCGFHEKRVHCLFTEFLSFLGPQKGMNKEREPRLHPRAFIRLLNARGIIAVGDKSATGVVCRALEALSKLGEGTRVTAKAFLKLMSVFEGSSRRIAAKTFFKMCDPYRLKARVNPIELLRLITEGLPRAHRPIVGAILGELLEQMGVDRPEELEYTKFVNAVTNDDTVYELFQALNPFARYFARRRPIREHIY